MIVMRVKVNEKQFDMIIDKLKLMVYEYNTKIKEYGVYLNLIIIVYKNKRRIYLYWKILVQIRENWGEIKMDISWQNQAYTEYAKSSADTGIDYNKRRQ